ncbi:MAG: hypothetical protein V1869_02635 [Candidatus Omnitrophota bacterium]
MNKEEALIEFLNGLRAAINNSLAYSRQHPFFLKTAQDFKDKIDQVFNFLNSVRVGVSSESLFLDGKVVEKVAFSLELARTLHQRKIKSIEFKPALTAEELADFLSILSLQPKEIIRSGGLGGLLRKERIQHIFVEDLDYSALLGSQGEDVKDVWLYMFQHTMEGRDERKITEFAVNFIKGVNNLSVKDIVEDDKLRGNMSAFLGHLKNRDKGKFSECSRELSGLIINSATQVNAENIGKLQEIFRNFDDKDLSDAISSQLASGKLNILNLGLFSRLAGEAHTERIASGLANNAEAKAGLKNNPAMLKRITDLLSGSDEGMIPDTYRSALIALTRDISPTGSFLFDRRQLRVNYRMIILDLLSQEETPEHLSLILKRLDNEWDDLAKEKDFGFLKDLSITLKQYKWGMPRDLAENARAHISRLVEDCIWEAEPSGELEYLAENLENISKPAASYLDRIFEEKNPSVCGVKLFLKFFPSQMGVFYERLKEKYSDFEFLGRIIRIVSRIDLGVSSAVLKEIFFFGNDLIKIEVLRGMRSSKIFDSEFLFSILKGENTILKKEALAVLLKDEAALQRAAGILLGIPSPWGLKNRLILENILVVEELNARKARDYLAILSKRRFFWNRQLRSKALKVLETWE